MQLSWQPTPECSQSRRRGSKCRHRLHCPRCPGRWGTGHLPLPPAALPAAAGSCWPLWQSCCPAEPPWRLMPCPAKRCAKCLRFSGVRNGTAKKAPKSGERGEVRATRRVSLQAGEWPSSSTGYPSHVPALLDSPKHAAPSPGPPTPCTPPQTASMTPSSTGYLQEAVREGRGAGWEPSVVSRAPAPSSSPQPWDSHHVGSAAPMPAKSLRKGSTPSECPQSCWRLHAVHVHLQEAWTKCAGAEPAATEEE